jgi:hypothetical protein
MDPSLGFEVQWLAFRHLIREMVASDLDFDTTQIN